ncbi:MAG: hypothetical protein U9R25_06275 [Chloroflexota bacterium]|nr:hypothetical protein [Chloroflexota bacterium]
MDDQLRLDRSEAGSLPTTFQYSLLRRVFALALGLAVSVPLITVLFFLAGNLPSASELGPVFVVLLFLLAPPVFAFLRFGYYFRRFDVGAGQLLVGSLTGSDTVRYRDITRLVRRWRRSVWLGRSYKVRIEFETADGKRDWEFLFDSALTGADDLYAQLVRHVSHIKPKEIDDRSSSQRWM